MNEGVSSDIKLEFFGWWGNSEQVELSASGGSTLPTTDRLFD